MDNATHTLCGLVLARAGGDRLGPLATPTLVAAANLPDVDWRRSHTGSEAPS